MRLLHWLIGGIIGGVIGGAIWTAIGYGTGYEVGWIAWGIGFIVGLGVRIAAGEDSGPGPGVVAAGISAVSILVAKFAVVALLVGSHSAGITDSQCEKLLISSLADEIIENSEMQVIQPADRFVDAEMEFDYPREVWTEASRRWTELPPEERTTRVAALRQFLQQFTGAIHGQAFRDSFSPYDGLWFLLAMFTAFKVGSGLASDNQ